MRRATHRGAGGRRPASRVALSAWIAYAQIKARPKESLIVAAVLAIGAGLYWLFASGKPPIPNENNPVDDDARAPAKVPTARVVDRDRS